MTDQAPFTVGDVGTILTLTVNANLTGATELAAHIERPDGTVLPKTAVATDALNGVSTVTWVAGDLSQPGWHEAELQVTFSGGGIQTFGPQSFYVQPQIA